MINVERLKNVKRLITHANCPDGIASALIVKDALPDVEVLFVSHGTKQHRELRPDVPTLFCDFTPWSDPATDAQWLMWLEAGTLVLDHHPTQRELTMQFVEAGLGAYGENDKNECGAWLAYEHVWRLLREEVYRSGIWRHEADKIKNFAELSGIRDTWKKEDSRWQQACWQAEALLFFGLDHFTGMNWSFVEEETGKIGSLLFDKKLEAARKSIKEGATFTSSKGTYGILFQGVSTTSDAAEILEQMKETYGRPLEIIAGFHYKVDAGKLLLQFSTRSHIGYDVGAFCKARGGGGHRAAAGFTVEQSPEVGANPYAVFKLFLEEWES